MISWLALSCCQSQHRPHFTFQCCASHILVPLALRQVLQQEEARYNSADLNIAYKMSVDEYQRLCPFAEALEENWGKPPGEPFSLQALRRVTAWLGTELKRRGLSIAGGHACACCSQVHAGVLRTCSVMSMCLPLCLERALLSLW